MESGLLYTTTTIIFFIAQVCKSPARDIVCAAVSVFNYESSGSNILGTEATIKDFQVAGIAFNLIVMRTTDTSSNPADPGDSLPVYQSGSSGSPKELVLPRSL
jgi:hypothetical protein